MAIDQEKILKKTKKIEVQNDAAKQPRKTKKELWKTQSLEESLYNCDKDGKRIPRASDVDQGNHSNINYLFKQYVIGDCYLLANLMGLAKSKPNFIQSELIKVKNKDEVLVGLYENKIPPNTKITEDSITMTFEPVSSKNFYPVTKAEAIAWKTCHLALWPVVIEIAYAKHLRHLASKNKGQFVENMRSTLRPIIKENLRQYYINLGEIPSDSEFEKVIEEIIKEKIAETLKMLCDQNLNLRTMFDGGNIAATTLTHLTGTKSKVKCIANVDITKLIQDDEKLKQEYQKFKGVDTSGIKAFQCKYSPAALKIYDKIRNKLKSSKIITINFKGTNPSVPTSKLISTALPESDNDDLAVTVIGCAKSLEVNPVATVTNLINQGLLKKEIYEKWLKDHKLNLMDLMDTKVTDEMRKRFILETVDFEKNFKISKTKSSIVAGHYYLVLDAFEHNGHNYIVLKNTHDIKTKINYKKSKKLPPEVKLPEQINKIKNECIMELNHFYKKLNSINYDK